MSDMRSGWTLTALALVLAGGCVKTRPTISTTKPAPETQVSETTLRVRELSRLAEEYGAIARQLPGRTPEEHRDLMRQVFAELGQILPLLENPRDNLIYRHQISIIEDSRTQLAAGSSDLAVQPTIDTGLRAAYHALAGVSQNSYFDQADLTPPLDQMSAKVDELDTVHGLTHSVVVGEAVEISSGIVSKMADALAQRISSEAGTPLPPPETAPAATVPAEPTTSPAATEPATAPVQTPATAPTEPATAPASQPTTAEAPASEPAATAPAATEPAAPESAPATVPTAPGSAPATTPATPESAPATAPAESPNK